MDVLKNKAYRTYQRISRYSTIPYYYNTLDNKYVSGTTHYLRDDTPYQLHKVRAGENFDTLAFDYYGNPTYYWVICSFNHIQDPFKELQQGSYIKIPSISGLKFEV